MTFFFCLVSWSLEKKKKKKKKKKKGERPACSVSPSSKKKQNKKKSGRPVVAPPAAKHMKDAQCLHQHKRVGKTCSVSPSNKECGRPAVSPPAVLNGGRPAVPPPAAKHVEDPQCLHQQQRVWKTCSVSPSCKAYGSVYVSVEDLQCPH